MSMSKSYKVIYSLFVISIVFLYVDLMYVKTTYGYDDLSKGLYVVFATLFAFSTLTLSYRNFKNNKLLHGFFFLISSVFLTYLLLVVLDIIKKFYL